MAVIAVDVLDDYAETALVRASNPSVIAQKKLLKGFVADIQKSLSSQGLSLPVSPRAFAGMISEATYDSVIQGPDTLTLSCWDPDWVLQQSEMLTPDENDLLPIIEINWPRNTDVWFRLQMVEGVGGDLTSDNLTLTFVHNIVSLLQWDVGALTATGLHYTDFAKQLVDRIPSSIKNFKPSVLGQGSSEIQFICPVTNSLMGSGQNPTSTSASSAKSAKRLNKQGSTSVTGTVDAFGSGNQVARWIIEAAMDQGLSFAGACGMVGNAWAESSLSPVSVQDPGTGVGLFQWSDVGSADRTNVRNNFWGTSEADVKGQVIIACNASNALSGAFPGGTPKQILAATGGKSPYYSDPVQAAEWFEAVFERAGVPALSKRTTAAQQAFGAYKTNGQIGSSADVSSDSSGNPVPPKRGAKEDSWSCLNRMASDINYACFTSIGVPGHFGNYLYFIPETYLAQAGAVALFQPNSKTPATWDMYDTSGTVTSPPNPSKKLQQQKGDGLQIPLSLKKTLVAKNVMPTQPAYTLDDTAYRYAVRHQNDGQITSSGVGVKGNGPTSVDLSVVCNPTDFSAGEVVYMDNCGPLERVWLIEEISRDLLAADLTSGITLIPPSAPKRQQKNSSNSSTSSDGTSASTSNIVQGHDKTVGNVVSYIKLFQSKNYGYTQGRRDLEPVAKWPAAGTEWLDCSSACALVLWLAGFEVGSTPVFPAGAGQQGPATPSVGGSWLAASTFKAGRGTTMTIWIGPGHMFMNVLIGTQWWQFNHGGTGAPDFFKKIDSDSDTDQIQSDEPSYSPYHYSGT